jgi:hypothetical protein
MVVRLLPQTTVDRMIAETEQRGRDAERERISREIDSQNELWGQDWNVQLAIRIVRGMVAETLSPGGPGEFTGNEPWEGGE